MLKCKKILLNKDKLLTNFFSKLLTKYNLLENFRNGFLVNFWILVHFFTTFSSVFSVILFVLKKNLQVLRYKYWLVLLLDLFQKEFLHRVYVVHHFLNY